MPLEAAFLQWVLQYYEGYIPGNQTLTLVGGVHAMLEAVEQGRTPTY